jgi:molybdopterin-guanine dinucleotide biosynthesis protein A
LAFRREKSLNEAMNLWGAIQAGGRSSRMGTDKAWVELAGRPLIEYVLAAAQPLTAQLAIIISRATPHPARYEQLATRWQAALIYDQHEYCGPLGGLHTALHHCPAEATTLHLACDMPCLTTEFLAWLRGAHAGGPQALTVPLDEAGRVQMLVGLYDQTCLRAAETLLAENRLRVDGLLTRVPARQVAFTEYAHLPHAAQLLRNLNTPEELRAALSQLGL